MREVLRLGTDDVVQEFGTTYSFGEPYLGASVVTSVPEPGTLGILGVAGLAAGLRRRRA